MSVTLTLNGTSHVIPTRNETNWGSEVTTYLQDIADVLDGTFQSVTVSGATTTIDFDSGKNVNVALGASTTLTLSNPRTGRPAVLWITQAHTANAITWPVAVKWPGGTAPDLSGSTGLYIVTLLYNSGTSTYVGEYGSDTYS
jgi:hypothetical protein